MGGEGNCNDRHHCLRGPDAAGWRPQALCFPLAVVEFEGGTSLRLREEGGWIAFDLELDSGRAAPSIALRVEGGDELVLLEDGSLCVKVGVGAIALAPPRTFELGKDGSRREIPSRFRILGANCLGFEVGEVNAGPRVLIDPGISYSSYLGGSVPEIGASFAVDAQGRAHVAGARRSADFPVTVGALDTSFGVAEVDGFVTKLAPDGASLEYSTYVGALRQEASPKVSPLTRWVGP